MSYGLIGAAAEGDVAQLISLLDVGADIDCRFTASHSGATEAVPLHCAVWGASDSDRKREAVRILIDRGANVNLKQGGTATPLQYAAETADSDIMKMLLDRGAYIDEPGYSSGALRSVTRADRRFLDKFKLLVTRGANIHARIYDSKKRTILHVAVTCFRLNNLGTDPDVLRTIKADNDALEEGIRLLLAYGARPDVKDDDGKIPLELATTEPCKVILREAMSKPKPILPIFLEAKCGNLKEVQELLASGVLIDEKDAEDSTALHGAVWNGHIDTVLFLLDHGADINAQNNHGWTALHNAAWVGRDDIVRLLLDRHARVDLRAIDGSTVLHCAAEKGFLGIIEMILRAVVALDERGQFERTALHWASRNNYPSVVSLLLASGAQFHLEDSEGKTPIMLARSEAVRAAFFEAGAVLKTITRLTELERAFEMQAKRLAELEQWRLSLATSEHVPRVGLRVESASDRVTGALVIDALDIFERLIASASCGDLREMERLFRQPIDLSQADEDGNTPLHRAAEQGQVAACRLLLSRGADINQQNVLRDTPLHIAVVNRRGSVIRCLLEYGADIEQRNFDGHRALDLARTIYPRSVEWFDIAYLQDTQGNTPLHRAIITCSASAMRLVEGYQRFDLFNADGHGVIHLAASRGRLDLIQQMMERGVDIDMPNAHGQTPLIMAESAGQTEVQGFIAGIKTPSMLRVWGGKYTAGQQPHYTPAGPKPGGDAIGAIFDKDRTKPRVEDAPKRWMGKVGARAAMPTESTARASRSLMRIGTVRDSIREKVAADLYHVLGHGDYAVPKTRLAVLPIENEHTRAHALTPYVLEDLNRGRSPEARVTDGVYVMSKWVDGYKDLATLEGCVVGGERLNFMVCLERGIVPELVEMEGQQIPLKGVMSVMAVSRLLADTDVLGGGAKNTGFVVERSEADQVTGIRIVKIDTGNSFNFTGEDNQLLQSFNRWSRALKLTDKRDLQYGNMQPVAIQWERLSPGQREEFFATLSYGLSRLEDPAFLNFMLQREGGFARAGEGVVSATEMARFMQSWGECLQMQEEVYGVELRAYRETHPPVAVSPEDAILFGRAVPATTSGVGVEVKM